MAAKRASDKQSCNSEKPEEKRQKVSVSLSIAIGEAMMIRSFQSFCSTLEPFLRNLVHEEVERGIQRGVQKLNRGYPRKNQALEAKPTFQLCFSSNNLGTQIFTNSKIEDESFNPLEIVLVDTITGKQIPAGAIPFPIKVEIVPLDGDFPCGQDWTTEEFNNCVVRERAGKRPLLAGDVTITVREGVGLIGELMFTDNSSWRRSRKFRLGARGSCEGIIIREAMTEAFVVKDHRGELYKKHYPPSLSDEVWRLEKIGKEGAFHRKLVAEGINTVQDFLKLWVINPDSLRKILGGMPDKMWEGTLEHAKTCVLSKKVYIHQGPRCAVLLNPICQVVGVMHDDQLYPAHSLTGIHKAYVDRLVGEAYRHCNALIEVDGFYGENALLANEQFLSQSLHQENAGSSRPHDLLIEDHVEAATYDAATYD